MKTNSGGAGAQELSVASPPSESSARPRAPSERGAWLAQRSRLVRVAKGVVGVGVAVGIWELLRALGVLPPKYAPSFASIVVAAARDLGNGSLLGPLGSTMLAWAIGLAIAAGIGLVLGALIGASRWAAATSRILVRFLRPVPSVALIPIAILVAGLGLKMILILVVFGSVWPILINTAYGVREVPALYRDTGRVMGLSRRQVLTRVTLLAAFPSVATGIRVATAIALVITIAAELITGAGGLGGFILSARLGAQYPAAYAAVLIGGLLGYLINGVSMGLERRLLFWSAEHREAQP